MTKGTKVLHWSGMTGVVEIEEKDYYPGFVVIRLETGEALPLRITQLIAEPEEER